MHRAESSSEFQQETTGTGCPENVDAEYFQDQVEQGSEQPGLVKGVPTVARDLKLNDL